MTLSGDKFRHLKPTLLGATKASSNQKSHVFVYIGNISTSNLNWLAPYWLPKVQPPAMENPPTFFLMVLKPEKNGGFSMAILVYQRLRLGRNKKNMPASHWPSVKLGARPSTHEGFVATAWLPVASPFDGNLRAVPPRNDALLRDD